MYGLFVPLRTQILFALVVLLISERCYSSLFYLIDEFYVDMF